MRLIEYILDLIIIFQNIVIDKVNDKYNSQGILIMLIINNFKGKKIFYTLLFLFLYSILLNAKIIFVSTSGNDNNDGSQQNPLATLSKAASLAVPGDTIYVRGGTYSVSSTISLGSSTKSGTAGNYYKVFAYPGEKPIFDFTKQISSDGIKLNGKYWYLKGIESCYAAHNGIAINGSYNIVENCIVHDNRNSGMQIGNGGSYNRIINCDSYYNFDAPLGGNADGFSPKLDVGTGNYFYGCRSWQNSDDGWDGYMRVSVGADTAKTILENCWTFMNGYLKNGQQIATGNGNGFKMGGSDGRNLRHNFVLKNCLAFDNRVKGFDQNNNLGSMTLYNCTGYRNGTYNFSIPSPLSSGNIATIINSISLESQGTNLFSGVISKNDSWVSGFSASSSDFITTDTTGVRGTRKADGSLPDVKFMHLSAGSKLIDAGIDVGIPFTGKAPDLGAFEDGMAMYPVEIKQEEKIPEGFLLEQNYPNPFNPSTTIRFQIKNAGHVSLKVFDIIGKEVATLVDQQLAPGVYTTSLIPSHELASGIYIYRLESEGSSISKKMILTK